MIDLTKYDGHTPGPWESEHGAVYGGGHCIFEYDSTVDEEQDSYLIADAPLLKSELARIYSELTQLTSDLENGSYTESITQRLRNILEGK